ncbi:MAG TPA: tripartite tricarboxylate transporter TctB family protein [Burkholderiales bacterium]|nr:tripartite tricarboxylate transporter TctB family protein [Burkholderiales bacterium]
MKFSRDGWAGLAVFAASLFLFALTLDLKPSPLVPIGPGFYPRIVLGFTAVLAAALVAFEFFKPKKTTREPEANYAAVVLHFAVFAVYVVALPWLGFRVATFAYVAAANALLDPPRSVKGWLRVGALALITAAVVYVAFEHYLSVLMPRGRWTGF